MTNKKQSSIEFLLTWLDELEMTRNKRSLELHLDLRAELFQQAKEMHKEEIVEAFNEGALDTLPFGEEYYQYVYEIK